MANLDTSICTRYVINRFSFSVTVPGSFNVTFIWRKKAYACGLVV